MYIINLSKLFLLGLKPAGNIALDGLIILDIHLLARPYVYIINPSKLFLLRLKPAGDIALDGLIFLDIHPLTRP
jgi:hypothetical protein